MIIRIYRLTNRRIRKSYVGQTKQTLPQRLRDHKHNKERTLVSEAIKEYGLNWFKMDLLCECSTQEEADEKEKAYIQQYNTLTPNGYNVEVGGLNNHTRGSDAPPNSTNSPSVDSLEPHVG